MKGGYFSEWVITITLLLLEKVIYKRKIFLGQNTRKGGSVVLFPTVNSVSVLPFKQYWTKCTSKLRTMDWNLCLFYWDLCVHLIKSKGSEFEPPQAQIFHSLSNIYTCWNIKIRDNHIFCCVLC